MSVGVFLSTQLRLEPMDQDLGVCLWLLPASLIQRLACEGFS